MILIHGPCRVQDRDGATSEHPGDFDSDRDVSDLAMYMAICRALSTARLRDRDSDRASGFRRLDDGDLDRPDQLLLRWLHGALQTLPLNSYDDLVDLD